MYEFTKILPSRKKFTTLILCRAMMTTIVLLEAWNNAWHNVYDMKKKKERPVIVTKSELWRNLILKIPVTWVSFSWAALLTRSGQSLVISYPGHDFLIWVLGDGLELLSVFHLFLSAEKTDTAFATSLRSLRFLLILIVRWHDLDWLLFRPVTQLLSCDFFPTSHEMSSCPVSQILCLSCFSLSSSNF